MERKLLASLMGSLRAAVTAAPAEGVSDEELLRRFDLLRDEAAFELLVRRHASLVFGVCRRQLPDFHDAEDALQATFLVLARRAGAIRQGASLGSWLYKVASRVAVRLRERNRRRARHERTAPTLPNVAVSPKPGWPDERAALDEEIQRLPAKYRRPVILCYLGGKTTAEAARELGCPRGTVLSRLAWARERLRVRLTRRGVAPAAVLAVLAAGETAAALPATLLARTWKGALLYALRQPGESLSPEVLTLTEGVLRAMFLTKAKIVAAVVLVLALCGAGLGVWAQRPSAGPVSEPPSSAASADRAVQAKPPASPRGQEAWLGVWERALDDGFHLTLRLEPDRLHGALQFGTAGKEKNPTVTMKADYGRSKDGLLLGLTTSVEYAGDFLKLAGEKGEKKLEEAATVGLAFLNQPFSLRLQAEGDSLTLQEVNLGPLVQSIRDEDIVKMVKLLEGAYRRKPAGGESRR